MSQRKEINISQNFKFLNFKWYKFTFVLWANTLIRWMRMQFKHFKVSTKVDIN